MEPIPQDSFGSIVRSNEEDKAEWECTGMNTLHLTLAQWFSTGGPWPISGPQQVSRVGHSLVF